MPCHRCSGLQGYCQQCEKFARCLNCHFCANCDVDDETPPQPYIPPPSYVTSPPYVPQPYVPQQQQQGTWLPSHFQLPPPPSVLTFNEESTLLDLSFLLGDPPKKDEKEKEKEREWRSLKRSRDINNNNNTTTTTTTTTTTSNIASSSSERKRIKIARKVVNTLAPKELDLGVATWNINHFEHAKEKLEVLYWLFENHPWLDVLVLQEINLKGRTQLESLDAKVLSDMGLAVAYGPLMRSLSIGDALTKPKLQKAEDLDIGEGFTLHVRKDAEKKSFRAKVGGDWVWIRPGQPEYYPIVYREKTVTHKAHSPWATYDGTRLELDTHYWTKSAYPKQIFTIEFDPSWYEDLDQPPQKRRVPTAIRDQFGDLLPAEESIEWGRKSSTRGETGVQRYPFTANTVDYEIEYELDTGWLTCYRNETIVPRGCRPIVVYDLIVREQDIHLGVVHTTPAGQGLNRRGEYEQVSQLFAHAGKDAQENGAIWIMAGDYYLDPEATVQRETEEEEGETEEEASRLLDLFKSALEQYGLNVVIPISATNQSPVDRAYARENYLSGVEWDKVKEEKKKEKAKQKEKKKKDTKKEEEEWKEGKKLLKSKTARVIRQTGRNDYQLLVVNKRADFFVCTANLDLHLSGILCPRGGLLRVDPNHNALNFWSDISDHAPVAALFSSSKRRQEIADVLFEPDDSAERWEDAILQLANLHKLAADHLAYAQEMLVSGIQSIYQFDEELCGIAAKLCLLIDTLLLDSLVQPFEPKRTEFDHTIFESLAEKTTTEALDTYLLKAVTTKESERSLLEKWHASVMQTAAEAYAQIQTLGYTLDDFDITSEHDTYKGDKDYDAVKFEPLPQKDTQTL